MRGSRLRVLLCALALAAAPVMADWKQDYGRGVEAAKDARWDDVARYMQSALAGNATPTERLRLYGQRYETYAPQHYAGLAAWRQGDCAAALRYWSQGGNEAFVAGFPELAGEERQGRAECGNRTASTDKPAPPVVAETPREIPPTKPAAPPPVAPPPSRPVVEVPPSQAPAVETSASLSAQILRPLLDAYLGGRYADVLKLSAKVPPTPRLRWHMLTLRSAAAFTLAQSEASADSTRIAREAAADARRSDPGLKPDPEFYSPRFIAFFTGQ